MLEFNFNPFPVLETERLLLRRLVLSDAVILYALRNNEDVMQYIDRPRQKDIEETELFIQKIDAIIDTNKDINWAITLKGEDRLLGTIGFYRSQPENHRSEIGYMLDFAYWRKGIMNEAIQRVIHYGFDEMKLHSIEACINPSNEASRGILLKNSFVKEGYFKENYFYNEKFSDTEVYSLLNSSK
jgi:ribosomal-protein-alanine N-acetyltransferase